MKSKNLQQASDKTSEGIISAQKEPSVCVRIGIIGCGYWGPNLIRNFSELPDAKVAALCDLHPEKLKPYSRKFPGMKLTTSFEEVINDPTIDAVVIATPISTHYPIASRALRAGKHVCVEKPLTGTVEEGEKLVRLARRMKKILMVGHTFEYHPAVKKITDLIKTGEIGRIHYIDSIRVNLGLYQSDGLNVIWDLAPHDLSIILQWLGSVPVEVSAWGQSFLKKGVEDIAFIRMRFPNQMLAHLHVSWLAPAKIRKTTLVGNKKMIIFDDLENVEKIKIVDQGAHLDHTDPRLRVEYRIGDILSPRVKTAEPLSFQCGHFVECILQNRDPLTNGERGLDVVRILEAADKSIKKGGTPVLL